MTLACEPNHTGLIPCRNTLEAGFEWLEMHFAHGYLGASFFSPLANQRTDEYGGSLENRIRFHREALDAVRAVWPERLPLTVRLGSDHLNEHGVQFDDAVRTVGVMKEHGLDFADLSLGMTLTRSRTSRLTTWRLWSSVATVFGSR